MLKTLNRIIVRAIDTKWQLFFCCVTIAVFAVLAYHPTTSSSCFSSIQKDSLSKFLLIITSVLALTTTLSIGFLVAFMQLTNARRFDLYGKFKSEIKSFFEYLASFGDESDLIWATEASLWEIDKLSYRDFPIINWDELIKPFMIELDKDDGENYDPNFPNRLAMRFGYIEELVSEIGIMCIRQALTSIFLRPVLKSLSLLMLALGLETLMAFWPTLLNIALLQVGAFLISILTILLFVEISYWIYREVSEHVDEVIEKNTD